ncbi:LexA family protein [Nicoliella lavandulae]|uniref:XRE family transcriptional regulator n=1 Tax=Nicoliella lavandulae TaxID=3082954 RepID=A0ABU8SM87_9LACO
MGVNDMANATNEAFGEKLRKVRTERGYSLRHLAYKSGVSFSMISQIERGFKSVPKPKTLKKLANGLNVPSNQMFEWAGIDPTTPNNVIALNDTNTVNLPILGEIACGEPILAKQNIDGYTPMVKGTLPSGTNFCLRCKGDSMEPRIQDGALVVIHQQPTVEDGEIAAVLIGNEATLKKVKHIGSQVLLMAINDKYDPIILDGSEDSRILGKAIQVITQL